MEVKELNQNLFQEFKIEEVKQFILKKDRKCIGCDKFVSNENELPKIESINKNVFSEETAYQMTSILQGTVERVLQKKLKSLKSASCRKNRNYK